MDNETLEALRADVEALRHETALLRDESEIRRLQYMYGYYDDYRDWEPLIALFADADCSVDIGSRGLYIGKERVSRFFREVIGQNRHRLNPGEIYNHLQLQMIITVDPDRARARGRSRALIQGSTLGMPNMVWAEGVYENIFVREDGRWKIEHMAWVPTFYVKLTGIEPPFILGAPASGDIPPDRAPVSPNGDQPRHLLAYHYAR